MKLLIQLMIICTLISGCGLFKKTTKEVDKKEDIVKVDEVVKEDKKSSKQQEKTEEKKREAHTADDVEIEADEIIKDDKGNISAKGNAKLKQKKQQSDKVEEKTKEKVKEEVNERKDSENKQEDKSKSNHAVTTKEPSGKGIVWGSIGVLIVVLGILFYFGIRPKMG